MKPGLFGAVVVAIFAVGFAVGRVSATPAATAQVVPTAAPLMAAPPVPPGGGVAGTIAEVIQVQSYTYLRLATPSGDEWAAVSRNDALQVGQVVRLGAATEMAGFTSKTLNRTFERIWFGELEGGPSGASAGAGGAQDLPAGHPVVGGGAPSAVAGALAAVTQDPGAPTLRVVDVFSERATLAGRSVRVAGTVARVTTVQGLNYAHLKDGSGAAGKDDDLIVITGVELQVNQQVVLEGRVVLDKDVGMGAPYPVALEGAIAVGR